MKLDHTHDVNWVPQLPAISSSIWRTMVKISSGGPEGACKPNRGYKQRLNILVFPLDLRRSVMKSVVM